VDDDDTDIAAFCDSVRPDLNGILLPLTPSPTCDESSPCPRDDDIDGSDDVVGSVDVDDALSNIDDDIVDVGCDTLFSLTFGLLTNFIGLLTNIAGTDDDDDDDGDTA
jgi:hypothetical protein